MISSAGWSWAASVYPKYMTCDYIVQYVRALQNEAGSNVKTLYRILDDRVEALEFTVHEESKATGVPLSRLRLKQNLLLCCIMRGEQSLTPRGGDEDPGGGQRHRCHFGARPARPAGYRSGLTEADQ